MKNWRLISNLVGFVIPSRRIVYLCDGDKKSNKSVVLSELFRIESNPSYKEINIVNNEFEVKIGIDTENSCSYKIFIKSQDFPEDEWYLLKNFYTNFKDTELSITSILIQVKNTNGLFNEKFEAVFSDSTFEVLFVNPTMKEYKSCFEEFKRRINCEIYKKTRKWIPGHRYDSLEETIYYLGEVKGRNKLDEEDFKFISDNTETPTYYLYTNVIYESDKNISDILSNRVFGTKPEDIKVSKSMKLMVDSGECLVDDFTTDKNSEDISKYWRGMLDKYISKKKIDKFGYETYDIETIKDILDVFIYQSPNNQNYTSQITSDIKLDIEKILEYTIFDVLVLQYWESDTLKYLKSSDSDEFIGDKGFKLLIDKFKSYNTFKYSFYEYLFNKVLGIDIKTLVVNTVRSWDDSKLKKDFDYYLKYGVNKYYATHYTDISTRKSMQRVDSLNYKSDKVTLKDIYGETEFKNALIEIGNSIISSLGLGCKSFNICNVGTKKSPKEYITFELNIDSILNYYKWSIPENIKSELMINKFNKLFISVDKGKELE